MLTKGGMRYAFPPYVLQGLRYPCLNHINSNLPLSILPGKLLYLQHILFRQAEVAVAADQVVVDRQVEALAGLHQGPGQLPVGG